MRNNAKIVTTEEFIKILQDLPEKCLVGVSEDNHSITLYGTRSPFAKIMNAVDKLLINGKGE